MSYDCGESQLEADILKELATIGIGNATSSLSSLIQYRQVRMEVPEVSLVDLQEVPEQLGGEEKPLVAVYISARGALDLVLVFALSPASAGSLIGLLVPEGETIEGELGQSALVEIGGLIAGAYVNAIASLTDLNIVPDPPRLAMDMAGAILGTILGEASIVDSQITLLKTGLSLDDEVIDGTVLIFCGPYEKETLFAAIRDRY